MFGEGVEFVAQFPGRLAEAVAFVDRVAFTLLRIGGRQHGDAGNECQGDGDPVGPVGNGCQTHAP